MSNAWNGVDDAHEDLVFGLIRAHKPKSVLEFGFGSGGVTVNIATALHMNEQDCRYTLVDNWSDFGSQRPDVLVTTGGLAIHDSIDVVTSSERDFVDTYKYSTYYDFIFSDADHTATEQWFDDVYDGMLNSGGILCYHDVNIVEDAFPNLRTLLYIVTSRKIPHKLFNKNSTPYEKCQRGLLVIFKP